MELSVECVEALRQELQDETTITDSYKSSLEKLELSELKVTEGALMELTKAFQSNTTLQEVYVRDCSLKDEDIAQIVDALATSRTLHTLKLSGTMCRSRSLQALARMLSNPKCQLKNLDLSYQKRGESILENLVLQGDGNKGDRGGWERDHSNKSLRRLDLSVNGISDVDMPSIILLLRRLTGLQVLSLHRNNISDRGLALLAQDRVPNSLRQLYLSGNKITHESWESVIDLLETHPELGVFTTGVLWSCSPSKNKSVNSKYGNGEDGASILNHLLHMNLAGRVLLRHPEGPRSLPLAAWSYVLSRVNRLSQENFYEGNI
jgi:Ran GTPase-activating protein (RanGAP) involved in mRNA processing and transport